MPEQSAKRERTGLPLSGKTVVVTRASEQAGSLADPLAALGAEVLVMPVIRIVPPVDWAPADAAIESLDAYDWIVLTSVNGVEAFDERLALHGLKLSDLSDKDVAVVGSATARRLREFGIEPALIPDSFRAEGVVDAFAELELPARTRVLVARAAEAREVLPDQLRELGMLVDVVPVYALEAAPADPEVLDRLRDGSIDAVTFASGGTARRFADALAAAGLDPARVLVGPVTASIGPVTTEALHGLGIAVDVEAPEATAGSLVSALADKVAGAGR